MSERERAPVTGAGRPNEIADAGRPPAAPEPNVLTTGSRRGGLASSTVRLLDASATQLGKARLPGISGRWSALALLGLFAVSAVVVPLVLHRALWVEAEAVIAAWFVIWTGALTWLGYAGRSVAADWGPYRSLWSRMRGGSGGAADSGGSSGGFDLAWLGTAATSPTSAPAETATGSSARSSASSSWPWWPSCSTSPSAGSSPSSPSPCMR
jgi:hypothetical protein